MTSLYRATAYHFLIASVLLYEGVTPKFQFCLKGQHEILSEFDNPSTSPENSAQCPGGILFNRPFTLKAVWSDSNTFCIKESICSDIWKCGNQKQSVLAQVITFDQRGQGGHKDLEVIILKDDNDIDEHISECLPNYQFWGASNQYDDILTRKKREISGLIPSEPSSLEEIRKEVDDQTKRMFYYLAGINQDQVNSHLRVLKLFKMCTELVSVICDPMHLRPKFLHEIEKGFLFLLKEQGLDNLIDLDLESYSELKRSLEYCSINVTMVKFRGAPRSCMTGVKVESVYTIEGDNIKSLKYEQDENSFKWGEYDVVLDAAWSIMNIVHGGCFEAFGENINLHHKFQVAMEQLFHTALHLRWENPTQLADDSFYDSIFMTRVNNTMKVMDACSRYLYLLTPFKTQLNRPIHETFLRRRKRSTVQHFTTKRNKQAYNINEESSSFQPVRKNNIEIGACLPSRAEMDSVMKSIRADVCK